jgi:hypothetical protein
MPTNLAEIEPSCGIARWLFFAQNTSGEPSSVASERAENVHTKKWLMKITLNVRVTNESDHRHPVNPDSYVDLSWRLILYAQ